MSNVLRYCDELRIELIWMLRTVSHPKTAWTLLKDLVLQRLMKIAPGVSTNRLRSIEIRGGAQISYRLNRADRHALQEIWMERAYKTPPLLHHKVLVDLGANIGLTSLWLSHEYGFSMVIAVEPSTENVAVLRKNLEDNRIASHVFEGAVGAKDGTATFDRGPSPTNGRLVSENGNPTGNSESEGRMSVPVFSMDKVFATLPPGSFVDLLKMDIEGGEQDVLTGNLEWLKRVRALVIEFHPRLADVPTLKGNLRRYGFKQVSSRDFGGDLLEVFLNDANGGGASSTQPLLNSKMD